MRFVKVMITMALLTLAAACSASSVPESSLTLRNATSNALVSTSKTTGSITLETAEEYPLIVVRTYKSSEGQTFNEDVTQFANFNWVAGASAASVDNFGNLTGLGQGTAILEVKFRESVLDPWDIVRLNVQVVEPAPEV